MPSAAAASIAGREISSVSTAAMMSMTGFAARPGTAVLPIRFDRTDQPRRKCSYQRVPFRLEARRPRSIVRRDLDRCIV
jgi:hypothetical protein